MLYEALQILTNEVKIFFQEQANGLEVISVVLDNIALAESEDERAEAMSNSVVVTLLTIDEESTLRNFPNNRIQNGTVTYRNDKVNLNLYVLFSGNLTSYKDSLRAVSKVIEFFQGKNTFTQSNSSFERVYPFDQLDDFRFTMELYTPDFEDLNYIWGTLGGRQFPSALYKLSLVSIEQNLGVTQAPTVTELSTDANNLTPNLDPEPEPETPEIP